MTHRVETNKIFVISLGGSLFFPDHQPDTDFLSDYVELITKHAQNGDNFIIIVGGGKICRTYQEAAREIKPQADESMDWLGIEVTRLNAKFLAQIFPQDLVSENIVTNPDEFSDFNKPIVLGAGWKPGRSTDYITVSLAEKSGAHAVVNLTNIDYVYESDPDTDPEARKFTQITWDEYLKLIPEEWDPGLSAPFDPIASRLARDASLDVVIMNGENLFAIGAYLDTEEVEGTLIHP